MVVFSFPAEFVAQFKFTLLLMPNGPMRITGGLFDPSTCKSEFSVKDEDLKVCVSKLNMIEV